MKSIRGQLLFHVNWRLMGFIKYCFIKRQCILIEILWLNVSVIIHSISALTYSNKKTVKCYHIYKTKYSQIWCHLHWDKIRLTLWNSDADIHQMATQLTVRWWHLENYLVITGVEWQWLNMTLKWPFPYNMHQNTCITFTFSVTWYILLL